MTKYQKILSHFKKHDPTIYPYMQNLDFNQWANNIQSNINHENYFHALTRDIIGQQLSGKAANAIYNKFASLFKGDPEPNEILEMNEQILRDAGLSWAKVRSVKDLAQKVSDQIVILNGLEHETEEEIIRRLIIVKGIGRWTAEMFLIFTLNRENIFSFGDLGLKKGIEKIYGIKDPTIEQMQKITSAWEPYKTYGTIALWRSLDS